ncbi:MAG: hypothetical protein QNK35_05875 [Bacteroides sp.]|nr:hypothetical protein [Bacteroides sp.]
MLKVNGIKVMFRKMMYKMMVFMSRRMIACDEASFLISYRSDQRLGFKRWFQLKFHLLTCHLCRKYASQINELNKAVDLYSEKCSSEECDHHLPNESRVKIEAIIVKEFNAK